MYASVIMPVPVIGRYGEFDFIEFGFCKFDLGVPGIC
jgi:hypothetical protein